MKRVLLLALLLLGDVNSPFDPSSSSSITAYASNNNRDGGCNACRMHEEIRALSLEAIKEQILNRLGLKQAPNMTGRALPRIPPISKLMDMYGMQADQPQSHEPGITYHEQMDEYSAKTESVFALAHPQQRLKYSQGSLEVLYFKFSDKIIQHRVTKAELSLWIQEKELVVNSDEASRTFVKHDGKRGVNGKIARDKVDDEEEEEEEEEGEKETTHHYHHHFHHRRYKYHHRHRRNHRYNNRRQHHDITQRDENELVTITLQRILRERSDNGAPLLGPPLKTKHLRPNGGKDGGSWVTIQLGRMVTEWFKHPRDNLGVVLKIDDDDNDDDGDDDEDDGGGGGATDNDGDDDDDMDDIHTSIGVKKNLWHVETDPNGEYAPYLEIQIQDRESRGGARVKRNVGLNCDEASQETRCCRYKLTVDFEKFGWDWIIAPKKYDANYCSGDCPMAFLPAYPNTHIVSLAEPPNNTGPCCAPRKLSEITMLYFDNEYQIVFSRLPGMVVERCGCS